MNVGAFSNLAQAHALGQIAPSIADLTIDASTNAAPAIPAIWWMIAGAVVLSYLVGSIPFGLLIAKSRGVDIRAHGSGNIGATNVWRVLGRGPGIVCFTLDVLKGLGPSAIAGAWLVTTAENHAASAHDAGWFVMPWVLIASASVAGHMYPIWLGFKGGKGVATSFGALLGVFPVFTLATLVAMIVWLISARLTRMVGISSCFAAITLAGVVVLMNLVPALAEALPLGEKFVTRDAPTIGLHAYFAIALATVVIVKHRANIARTIAGTENRIGASKATSTSERGA